MSIATLPQAMKVLELITQSKVPSEQMQAVLESGLLSDLFDGNISSVNREEFRKVLGLKKLVPDVIITELTGVIIPEQSVTFGDRIAAGAYDWKNDDLTEKRFPLTLPAGPRNLFLAHFNKTMTSEKVEAWAAENGYEVALIDDLLAVGSHAEYKELQRQFPIVALGSSTVVGDGRRVPYLRGCDSERNLGLGWCGDGWDGRFRFLLSRKAS